MANSTVQTDPMNNIVMPLRSRPGPSNPSDSSNLLKQLMRIFHFHSSDGYGLVLQQTYGVWHTKCFPKSSPPSRKDLMAICQQLGYKNSSHVRGNVLSDTSTQKYRQASVKAVIENQYSPLKLNSNFTLKFMKPSKPIATLRNWDQSDRDKCSKLEINCNEHLQ